MRRSVTTDRASRETEEEEHSNWANAAVTFETFFLLTELRAFFIKPGKSTSELNRLNRNPLN